MIQNRRRLSNLEESDADRVLIWVCWCGFSDHKSAALPRLITSAWPSPPPWLSCERTSGELDILHGLRSGNVQTGPLAASWAGIFSCGLYLQDEQWVSCLHAAPTVTSLHMERAAVRREFYSTVPSHRSLLDWFCDVVKRFAAQATIFKNTSQWRKTSPYLSHNSANWSCFAVEI